MALGLNLAFATIFVVLGLYCIIAKRNMIKTVIGIEIMAKGVAFSFLATGGATAQVIVVVAIAVDAIIAALMLSLIVNAHKHSGSLNLNAMRKLQG
jgi:multicomponent Na+:H+ antiporter subunit C